MGKYFSSLKAGFNLKNYLMTFMIIYLPIFSFIIFGPTEIFFGNYKAFGVIFSEFGWLFLKMGTLVAAIVALFLLILPGILQKILLTGLWGFSICGYVQTMFLNKNLDQIGATLDGYIPSKEVIVKNLAIWAIIIVISIMISIFSKQNWKSSVFFTSFVLVATQAVAYSTLILTAPIESTQYIAADYYLSGEEQYTVSSKENVIVFILDTLSNEHLLMAEEDYPNLKDSLKDFTYYNNTDCSYLGTFPSVVHIFSGYEMDPTKKINDWLYALWNSDATTRYYDSMHDAGYKIKAYLVEPTILTGVHSLSLLSGKIDNLTDQTQNFEVNHALLYQTLLEMSCYRFLPDYFKPYFDVPNTQYASIVTYPENKINYANPEYYADLINKGLTTNDEKYVIFQHLNGIHELINDENCIRSTDSSLPQTVKGIWTLLDEYILQLQKLGVYDNSTIIITADHGTFAYPQSIFFIKHANEHHDELQISNAPITLDELAPTIAEITTGEHDYLGNTIYDFSIDEERERTLYIGTQGYDYPAVKRYDGLTAGSNNVFRLYTYTGNAGTYLEMYELGIFTEIPVMDSYY